MVAIIAEASASLFTEFYYYNPETPFMQCVSADDGTYHTFYTVKPNTLPQIHIFRTYINSTKYFRWLVILHV